MKASMEMKKEELIEIAKNLGIEFSVRQSKEEIFKLIEASADGDEKDQSPKAPVQKSESDDLPKGDQNAELQKHPKFAKFNTGEKNQ